MDRLVRRTTLLALSTLVAGSYLLMLATSIWAKGNAKAGKTSYDAKCAMCHAEDGSGNSPMGKNMHVPDLRSSAIQKESDAQLASVIAKGKKMMPAYGSQLSKAQINDLVAYIRSLASKKK